MSRRIAMQVVLCYTHAGKNLERLQTADVQYRQATMSAAPIHQTPFAGSWYPADRDTLHHLLARLFRESAARSSGPLLEGAAGFVVPHAGLAFSGRVAAAAYRHLVERPPRTVILLGFSHRGSTHGFAIPAIDAYRTPLGDIPVDHDLARSFVEAGPFRLESEEALCDHSVEMQLPLLQFACPDVRVLPVYVSSLAGEQRDEVARALAPSVRDGAVVIASSDFTHYGRNFHYEPFPLDQHTPMRLRTLDEGFIDAAGSIDAGFFASTLRAQSATVCGREPIALLLSTLRQLPQGEDFFQQTLDYEASGAMTGDYGHSVSYAALGHFPWSAFQLDEGEQALLLDAAQRTLNHYQQTGSRNPPPPEQTPQRLQRTAGAFVTLRSEDKLRGCIGRIANSEPLVDCIPELVLSAALNDRRFEPLRPGEFDVEIDISVLSPLKLLPDRDRLRPGVDGGYLKVGGLSGLLLPQVASSRDWTASQFFDALARKTGVTLSAYDDPSAKLYTFRAQVIH